MEPLIVEVAHDPRAARAWLWAMVVLALLGLASRVTSAHGATIDLNAGVLSYTDDTFTSPGAANDLVVTLVGGTYTVDDPAEATITLQPGATSGGCAPLDANTINCPAAAITSFTVLAGLGDDHVTLTGVAVPTTVTGGRGNDTLVGGSNDDVFTWNPGDGSDTIDGGPGNDTLSFFGANIAETITIAAQATGFTLFRNIAAVTMAVQHAEALTVTSVGGADTILTTALAGVSQDFVDGIFGQSDELADVLRIDAGGTCPTRQGDTVEAPGRGPIHFVDFPQVFVDNTFCPLDPCNGAVASQGCTVNHVRNQPCQGTSGDDVIAGTRGADVILGGGGRDRISGGAGDDLLCGEEG